jgi:hypothetical protein
MATLPLAPTISFVQGDDLVYTVTITQSGYATRTNGSTILVGSNTFWDVSMAGCNITFPTGIMNTIVSVTDYNHLILATPATTTDTRPIQYFAVVNITGYTLYFTVKEDLEVVPDTEALIALPPITSHIQPLQGLTVVSIPNSYSNIEPGSFFYDLRLVDTNNKLVSIRYGEVIVYPAMTQRVS